MRLNQDEPVVHSDVIYISNQMSTFSPNLGEQTYKTLKQMEIKLDRHHSNKYNIIKVNIYVPNLDYWSSMKDCYQNFFGSNQPNNSIIPTYDEQAPISFEMVAKKMTYANC